MAIIEIRPNIRPMILESMACAQDVTIVNIPNQVPSLDFCICDYECAYEELAFAKVGGTDYQNDKLSFLVTAAESLDTIDFKMISSDDTEYPLVDSTYGEFFALGSFTEQPLKQGFVLDWEKVLTLLGGDRYRFEIEQTSFGNLVTTETHKYTLRTFSEILADGTVRIKTIHDGVIEGGDDYRGLSGWTKWQRLPGRFGNKTPKLEQDEYKDSNRKVIQIQDEVLNSYTLDTDLIPSNVSNQLTQDQILANRFIVDDYNLFNNELVRDLEIKPSSMSEPKYFDKNTKGVFSFEFEDRTQNIVKRNL